MADEAVKNFLEMAEQIHPVVAFVFLMAGLLLYLNLLFNQALWMKCEILLGISYVASLGFSDSILSFWLGGYEGDELSKAFLQLVLLGMVGQASTFYFTKYSLDPVVNFSLSVANILSRGGLLISAVYALFYVKEMSQIALKFDCIFLTLLLIGDMVHLKKLTTKDGSLSTGSVVRSCVIIDALLTFSTGAILLSFPEMFIFAMGVTIPVTHVSKVFMQSFGYQLLAGSVLSFSSLCFREADDVKSILLSKIVVYAPVLIVALLSTSTLSYYIIIAISGFLTVNAALPMWSCKEKVD